MCCPGWTSAWDAQHFQRIATFGYREEIDYTFPLLFPLAVKTFTVATGIDVIKTSAIMADIFNYLTPFVVILISKQRFS
ncbi:mannosyltransferase family protein [Pyrobaculum islandicum]|uniref:mannosyltransferase family protein n=1 Tax=Pyrobaculum islandicum TaxID=2277 RepID=UPI0014333664